jgi:hypothetical protein
MAIPRGLPPARTVELAARAWDLGLDCVEIPIQTTERSHPCRELWPPVANVGAGWARGTVTATKQSSMARASGAAFTVAAGLDTDRAPRQSGLPASPSLPGVATASEVQQATGQGTDWWVVGAFNPGDDGDAHSSRVVHRRRSSTLRCSSEKELSIVALSPAPTLDRVACRGEYVA